MKSHLILFVLCLILLSTNCEVDKRKDYDLHNSVDHVFVVQMIFEKLHLLFNMTSAISNTLDGINKRFGALDKRVDDISEDLGNFKLEISKKVQDQANLVQTSLKTFGDVNASLDYETFKSDISKTVQDRNDAFKTELNQRFDELNQMLKKSSHDIADFKTEISKTVDGQNISLHKIMNETLQFHERQQNQIKTLWENGSMNKSNDWSIILRRQDGSVNFNRNWEEYKNGFGNPDGEFFIGLEALHKMTTNGLRHEMFITLENYHNQKTYAKYDNIVIGSEAEQYALNELGNHTGDADDSLRHHEGEMFTTIDRDNDNAASENCAQVYNGPWWFYKCNPSSQLFGPYNGKKLGHRIRWSLNKQYELKFVEIKIRQT